jgi:PIN domain nuclease of toxin-antitoxin system
MASYVTDTHPFLWFTGAARGKLSAEVRRIFQRCERGEDVIYVPAGVVWESALILEQDKIRLPPSFRAWWDGRFACPTLVYVSLELAHIQEAYGLQALEGPLDRLIVGTTRVLGLPLITRDRVITDSGLVEVRW